MEHLEQSSATVAPLLEESELLRLREQVRGLESELEAKSSRLSELLKVVEHVAQEAQARRHAEEKLKMAQEAAQQEAAEKDRRYAELFHLVCQVVE